MFIETGLEKEDRGNLILQRFTRLFVRLFHMGPGVGKLGALPPGCHHPSSSWAIFLRCHPAPSHRPQPSFLTSWHMLPRAGAKPHLCARAGAHTSGPLLSSAWVLLRHVASQGKASLPPLVLWAQNKSSLQCPRERGTQTALGSALPGL